MIKSVGVQFSGNGKGVYWYFVTAADAAVYSIKPGVRAVVPTKMKDDNTVSLSIATVVEVKDIVAEGADKPVITFIDPVRLAEVTAFVAALQVAAPVGHVK